MPIRINLLAEQQDAIEMRRKDPMKRMLYAGIIAVSLTVFWIISTQMKVNASWAEMNKLQADIDFLEPKFVIVKKNETAVGDANANLASLERYSTNRFYTGSLLNAIQSSMVDKIRLTEVRTFHKYHVSEPVQVFTTNMWFPYIKQPALWKIWASPIPDPPVENLVSNQWNVVTNARAFSTNYFKFTMKATVNATNEIDKTVRAQVDFNTVPASRELITVQVRGKDFGTPYGSTIDELINKMNVVDFFKERMKGRGFSIAADRTAQPQQDSSNPADTALFVPFTIDVNFAERILDNEK